MDKTVPPFADTLRQQARTILLVEHYCQVMYAHGISVVYQYMDDGFVHLEVGDEELDFHLSLVDLTEVVQLMERACRVAGVELSGEYPVLLV